MNTVLQVNCPCISHPLNDSCLLFQNALSIVKEARKQLDDSNGQDSSGNEDGNKDDLPALVEID